VDRSARLKEAEEVGSVGEAELLLRFNNWLLLLLLNKRKIEKAMQ